MEELWLVVCEWEGHSIVEYCISIRTYISMYLYIYL